MVLRASYARAALWNASCLASRVLGILCALSSIAGCIPRSPPVHLAARVPAAVAFVRDHGHDPGVSEVADALRQAVLKALRDRNLDASAIPFDREEFMRVRDSHARLTAAEKAAPEAEWVLLIETRAEYFALIDGIYRWTVEAQISAARRGSQTAVASTSLTVPVFLYFDHEREDEALASSAPTIAERCGLILDGVLRSQAPAAALEKPRGGAVYFVLVDRFANGDPSNDGAFDRSDPAAFHGGDLQGVLEHLDDLQALGVETVWLSPVFRMRTEKYHGYGAYHGYWIRDLNAIEPRFGTVEQLARLSEELHRRGMRLLLDVVLNHVAFDSPLLTEHPDWFHHAGNLTDWKDPEQLVMRDVQGLPDLAQEKEEVYRYLTDASLRWIRDVHPDGFRLDAVKHVPSTFWSRYAREIRGAGGPSFQMLGEHLDGDPKNIARAWREGTFDSMFDFPFAFSAIDVFCKDQPPARLAAVLSNDHLYPDPASLVTLLDDHDLPRLATQCGGDFARMRDALIFLLTARGTPAITYGTEIGMTGTREPENRADMRFDATHPIREIIAQTLALRRAHPSLRDGVPEFVEVRKDSFSYLRVTSDEAALITVNRGASAVDVSWPTDLPERATVGAAHSVSIAFVAPRSPSGFRTHSERARSQWLSAAERRRVEFEVAHGQLRNETLSVVGSAPELGAWNPAAGVGIGERDTAACELPTGAVVEYKLVARRAGGQLDWEPGENHALFVRRGDGPLRLRLAWNGS